MLAPWVVDEMEYVELNDKRLNDRLMEILSQLGGHPTASIPAACGGYAETAAAYRFFDNERWLDGYRQACDVAKELPQTQFVCVADSDGDIYEVFEEAQQERAADWIIRSCHDDRVLEKRAETDASCEQANHLRDRVLAGEVLFTQSINVRGRKAKVESDKSARRQPRDSRTTEVEVRAARVTLRAPWRPDRKLTNVAVNAVLVTEVNPPDNDQPVEWLLLTSLPIDRVEAVLTVVQYYCVRWMIEVFFRTLKSGCRVEARRFERLDRLERCLAVYLIVTWRTLFVCRLGREFPDISCEAVFEADEWKSVYRIVREQWPPSTPPPLQEMVRMVAQLGGYINRSRDDEPGPKTVWLGLQRAHDIAKCWRIFGPDSRNQQILV